MLLQSVENLRTLVTLIFLGGNQISLVKNINDKNIHRRIQTPQIEIKKINHLRYMDDNQTVRQKRLETLMRIYSEDIGMEFGIEKYSMLIMKKQKTTNYIRNRTTKSRKTWNAWRKGNLQILGDVEIRHDQTCEDERKKLKKKYLRRTRKLLETT